MSALKTFTILAIVLLESGVVENVTVCPSFKDYYTRLINKRCYDDPDSGDAPAAIVRRWGMNFEEFSTTTEDGYILGIFRVYKTITKANPVVIGHGAFQNALAFLLIGNKSLAYVLGTEGFDVWLINFRGSRYSNNHLNLTVHDEAFWLTGFEKMGMYDMKAVMELVYEKTSKKSIYIGYSMGTITSYIFNIVEEVLAQKTIQNIISLAPVIYLQHSHGFNAALLGWPVLKPTCRTLWHGEVLPRAVSTPVVKKTCLPLPFRMVTCELASTAITGSEVHQMDPLTYPVTIVECLDSATTGTLDHLYQWVKSGRFARFDYGSEGNKAHYGQPNPPDFDLNKLTVPVTMFVGPNDKLANKMDAKNLYDKLPQSTKCGFNMVQYSYFSHLDFYKAKDIVPLLYNRILETISSFQENKC